MFNISFEVQSTKLAQAFRENIIGDDPICELQIIYSFSTKIIFTFLNFFLFNINATNI